MAASEPQAGNKSAASGYIHALDGLRALAVVLVLLFHAGFNVFRGGFVGVDVFFVLSGFLITRNIARDLGEGQWRFSNFYARRIARLLPALFVTLLASLIAAAFILSPQDLERLGRVGLYATISASNIFFWLESGYFDQFAQTKPFLHTWSLGVEEQFYLIWPLIIYGLFRWKGVRASLLGLATMAVISLFAALWFNRDHPSAVFFLTPFRIYQFAMGGMLALSGSLSDGRLRAIIGWLGVFVLCAIGITADGDTANLWLNAIAPALAATAFIWSAQDPSVQAVFASAPLKWIGRRSYSIYLVHWPIMVLWPMASDYALTPVEGVVAIVASIVIGAILHKLVEKPLRFNSTVPHLGQIRRLGAAGGLAVLCLVSGAHLWGLRGLPWRAPEAMRDIASMLPAQRKERAKFVRTGRCNLGKQYDFSSYDVRRCATPPGDRRAYMVIGDSHGAGAYMLLSMAYPDVYFGQLTAPGCLLKPPTFTNRPPKGQWCNTRYARAFELAANGKFDGVVLASDWRSKQEEKILDGLVEWAQDHDLDIVIMSHRPRFRERAPVIVSESLSASAATYKAQSLLIPEYRERADKLKLRLSGKVKIVDMFSILCSADCPILMDNRRLAYVDTTHLSVDGARWAASRLAKAYPNLFALDRLSSREDFLSQ